MNNTNTIIVGLVVVLAGSWAWFAYSNGTLPAHGRPRRLRMHHGCKNLPRRLEQSAVAA